MKLLIVKIKEKRRIDMVEIIVNIVIIVFSLAVIALLWKGWKD